MRLNILSGVESEGKQIQFNPMGYAFTPFFPFHLESG